MSRASSATNVGTCSLANALALGAVWCLRGAQINAYERILPVGSVTRVLLRSIVLRGLASCNSWLARSKLQARAAIDWPEFIRHLVAQSTFVARCAPCEALETTTSGKIGQQSGNKQS